MSCIQLSEKHIAAVAHGLAFILNGAGGMCRLAASYELPELCDALSACRYPHDFLFDDRKIYAVLYKLNEAAYTGRYHVEAADAEDFPIMPTVFPPPAPSSRLERGALYHRPRFLRLRKAAGQFHLPVQRGRHPEQSRSKGSFRHFPRTVCIHRPELRRI